jgi:hypothetical protein
LGEVCSSDFFFQDMMFIHVTGALQSSRNIDMIVSTTGSKTEGQSNRLFRVMAADVLCGVVLH